MAGIDNSACASISRSQPRGFLLGYVFIKPPSIVLMKFVVYMAGVARSHRLHFTWPVLINLLGLAIHIASVDKSNGKL